MFFCKKLKVKPSILFDPYPFLEQGGFSDDDQQNLLIAAAGRIKVAIDYNQLHFDDMEKGHQIY